MSKLVRIKPYNKKIGHVLKRYTVFRIRFEERRGWYKVSDRVANYLKDVDMEYGVEGSKKAFDVCTEKEAKAMEAAELRKAQERANATEPNLATSPKDTRNATDRSGSGDLTTADLREGTDATSDDDAGGDAGAGDGGGDDAGDAGDDAGGGDGAGDGDGDDPFNEGGEDDASKTDAPK